MLGTINPQNVKVDQQAVVYPGRNHVTTLTIKRYDGRSYKPVDLDDLTRAVLVFPGTSPTIAFDSATDSVFTWAGNVLTIDLSDYAMPESIQPSHLIVFDAEHPQGQVLVDNLDSRLEFDFRLISTTGTLPPPEVEFITDAPQDGDTYGRKDGVWVSLESVVSGVASVNGQSGIVVLDAADVGAATTAQGALADSAVQPGDLAAVATSGAYADLSGTPTLGTAASANTGDFDPAGAAAGAVAAHVGEGDPHPQYQTQAEGDARYERGLVAGTNITIDRTNPAAPVINAAGGGVGAVDSVNGQTGVVVLDAADVGADATGTAATAVAAHVAAADPHTQYLTGTEADAAYAPLGHVGAGGTAHANAVASGAAGFMTGADKAKLDGVAAGATANDTDANLKDRANHTGSQLASTISDFATSVRSTVLSGLSLADSTVVAATDSVLQAIGKLAARLATAFNRDNHTGTQAISTVTGLQTTLDSKQATLVSGTNIKTINGESLVGPGNVTVSGGGGMTNPMTTAGDVIVGGASGVPTRQAKGTDGQVFKMVAGSPAWAAESGGAASNTYATAAISSGTLSLNRATAQTFGVVLNANVTTLTLSGAVSGERSSIDVIFSQSMAGGFSISKPANVRLFGGAPNIASTSARDITYARFTSVDGGENWLLDERKVFLVPPTFTLPTVTTENFINNDEGDSTSGWSATNGTLSTSSSWLRFTKTAGGSSASSTKTLGTPISTAKDWIEYVSIRASADSNNVTLLGLAGSSGSIFSVWLNSANAATYTAGAVSFQYWDGSSAVASPQVAGASVSSTTPLNLAIQYDNKFGSLTVWVRQSDGRYKFGCRVSCPFFAIQTATLQYTTFAPAASWVEFDYRSMCNPNFAAIGDSIAEGKNGFSPTVALGLTNDETTWMRHAPLYPALRNNLVVSKGVGANNSAAILARISDVTTLGAKVVFLHCSTNDAVGPVPQATRASNIQGSVDAIVAASAQVVLLNSVYGTESNALNPGARNYYKESWDIYIPAITGVFSRVDTMAPIVSPAGFMLESLTDTDKIHLNQAGAAAVGGYIAS